jgi:hypothetical protein
MTVLDLILTFFVTIYHIAENPLYGYRLKNVLLHGFHANVYKIFTIFSDIQCNSS